MKAFQLRDAKMAKDIIASIKALDVKMVVMHVCGTHQDTLVRFGLEEMLADAGISIRQGPGCPVCVTPPVEIEMALCLARKGKTIAVFGDMSRVPSSSGSLHEARAAGADVRIVYGVDDAVKFAKEHPKKQVVFMAIGFETTSPSTASVIASEPPKNMTFLSCHRLVPPALKAIAEMGEVRLDGLIEPGHVSVIIGTKPYEFLSTQYKLPQVVAGFEPLDLLMACYMLAKQKKDGVAKVENEYSRAVNPEGNPAALKLLDDIFTVNDAEWRGFGYIAKSAHGLSRRYAHMDARRVFEDDFAELEGKKFGEPKGCKCAEVLRGLMTPRECPMFGKGCRPDSPVGPCMVSAEGSCNILFRHSK